MYIDSKEESLCSSSTGSCWVRIKSSLIASKPTKPFKSPTKLTTSYLLYHYQIAMTSDWQSHLPLHHSNNNNMWYMLGGFDWYLMFFTIVDNGTTKHKVHIEILSKNTSNTYVNHRNHRRSLMINPPDIDVKKTIKETLVILG